MPEVHDRMVIVIWTLGFDSHPAGGVLIRPMLSQNVIAARMDGGRLDSAWHIVRAAGRTDLAITVLTRIGFDVYYPKVLELRRLSKRQMSSRQRRAGIEIHRPQLVPLFPGYIFVHFNMTGGRWREAFRLAGVGGLVCEGGLPVYISSSALARIKGIERNDAIEARTEKMRVVFGIGQEVKINSGPFAEFYGIMQTALDLPFDQVDPSTRIMVVVNCFGRSTNMELDIWQVDAVKQLAAAR